MKAIKLTQDLKDLNQKLFEDREVGEIFKISIPKTLNRETGLVSRYDLQTDLHEEDGIKDLSYPENFNPELQNLGEIVETESGYVYTATDKPEDEVERQILRNAEAERKQALQSKLIEQVE